jgi:hypothetical protein
MIEPPGMAKALIVSVSTTLNVHGSSGRSLWSAIHLPTRFT